MTRHLLLLALSIVLLASCGPRQQQGNTISVSILPERYFVERIAGDRVKVNVMVPRGRIPPASTSTQGNYKRCTTAVCISQLDISRAR